MSAKMKAFFSETYAAFDESKAIGVSLKIVLFASTASLIYSQGSLVLSVEKFSLPKYKNGFDLSSLQDIYQNAISSNVISIEVIYSGADFCLVPNKFYKKELIPSLFDILSKEELKVVYQSEEVAKLLAFACYSIQENIQNLFSNATIPVKLLHNSTVLINHLLSKTQINHLHLRVSDQSFECALLNDDSLMFFNQFKFKTLEEFVYFVMSIYNSFDLDVLSFPIIVSGTIAHDSKIIELLNKYVKNVQFTNTASHSVAFAKEISLSCFPHLEM